MNKQKHIVIIGAGFAGLKVARTLNNKKHYSVTLIDKNNYHQFQPLLYQVATADLDASNISFPLRSIFHKSKNVRIRIAEVLKISSAENLLETTSGNINYDYLVIATGTDTNYFGNKNIAENAFPMKSTLEALQIRNQLIKNFEEASVTADQTLLEKLLTVVIVGGGPTGIELSGALAEMKRLTLSKDYPEIDFSKMKIYLLEGANHLLSAMSSKSSEKAEKYLSKMGVIIKTNTIVKDYNGSQVELQNGNTISSSLVLWAAGVTGKLPEGINLETTGAGNRIKVDGFNKVENYKNIFAIGDIALVTNNSFPKGYPQLANVAVDQAKNIAANFIRLAEGKKMKEYKFSILGSMATVGRTKAVVDLVKPKISFQGSLAAFVWMTVHLFLLIGFKNRIMVFINWAYKYLTQKKSLSLFFSPLLRKNKTDINQNIKTVNKISP